MGIGVLWSDYRNSLIKSAEIAKVTKKLEFRDLGLNISKFTSVKFENLKSRKSRKNWSFAIWNDNSLAFRSDLC